MTMVSWTSKLFRPIFLHFLSQPIGTADTNSSRSHELSLVVNADVIWESKYGQLLGVLEGVRKVS